MDLRFQRELVLRTQRIMEIGEKYLRELQEACPHEKVVATLYVGEANDNSVLGVCLFCGMKENPGYEADFTVFHGKPTKWVSNEVFSKEYEHLLATPARSPLSAAFLPIREVEAASGFEIQKSAA